MLLAISMFFVDLVVDVNVGVDVHAHVAVAVPVDHKQPSLSAEQVSGKKAESKLPVLPLKV